jgi:UDP:flavonoid glycosyltransferase YjiC (YdhE family)
VSTWHGSGEATVTDVLFVPYSARGHVSPMLAVAAELARRAATVHMIAGTEFRAAVEQSGVRAVPLAHEHAPHVPAGYSTVELRERVVGWCSKQRFGVAGGVALARELAGTAPQVCVIDAHLPWAVRMASRLGFRTTVFWTTFARSSRGNLMTLVNALPELQPVQRDTRLRLVGPLIGPITCPDPGIPWDRLEPPVLLVSSGTVFAAPPQLLRTVITAFARTEWTVVLSTGSAPPGMLGDLPPNVFAYPQVPQRDVLRRADVFLTHGGMNSVHEAILAGVPMLLAPRNREQRHTARTLHRLGVGDIVSDRDRPRRQIEQLRGPEVLAAVAALRMRAHRARGLADAVEALLP